MERDRKLFVSDTATSGTVPSSDSSGSKPTNRRAVSALGSLQPDSKVKLVLLGDSGVGKTCLVKR